MRAHVYYARAPRPTGAPAARARPWPAHAVRCTGMSTDYSWNEYGCAGVSAQKKGPGKTLGLLSSATRSSNRPAHGSLRARRHALCTMSEVAKGCSHFAEFRRVNGLQSYRVISRYLVKPGPEARKLKVYLRQDTRALTHVDKARFSCWGGEEVEWSSAGCMHVNSFGLWGGRASVPSHANLHPLI